MRLLGGEVAVVVPPGWARADGAHVVARDAGASGRPAAGCRRGLRGAGQVGVVLRCGPTARWRRRPRGLVQLEQALAARRPQAPAGAPPPGGEAAFVSFPSFFVLLVPRRRLSVARHRDRAPTRPRCRPRYSPRPCSPAAPGTCATRWLRAVVAQAGDRPVRGELGQPRGNSFIGIASRSNPPRARWRSAPPRARARPAPAAGPAAPAASRPVGGADLGDHGGSEVEARRLGEVRQPRGHRVPGLRVV